MAPSKKDKRSAKARGAGGANSVPSATTKWSVAFYRTAKDVVPARKFLLDCPQPVREKEHRCSAQCYYALHE